MQKKKIPTDEVSLAWEAIRKSKKKSEEANEEKPEEENETLEETITPAEKSEFVSILPQAREERNQNLENSLAGTEEPIKEEGEKKPREVQYGFKQQSKKYSTGESSTAFRAEEVARPEQTIRQIIRAPQMREAFHEARQVREFMPSAEEDREYSLNKFSELKTTELQNPLLKERELMKAKYAREEE